MTHDYNNIQPKQSNPSKELGNLKKNNKDTVLEYNSALQFTHQSKDDNSKLIQSCIPCSLNSSVQNLHVNDNNIDLE